MKERERNERGGEPGADWTTADAQELYGVEHWGRGAFRVGAEGHLHVTPEGTEGPGVDLHELVESLRLRDLSPPLLIRFHDLLSARLLEIRSAFDTAMERSSYRGGYSCLYPIKVNQERFLCEEIRDLATELDFGLEAGSKPELLAVLGLTATTPELPIVCNGFKDDEFIETVILGTKLGRDIVPIVEKPSELELILKYAQRYEVRPRIGVRIKLHSKGSGKWESSGGARSKFGLFAAEVLDAVDRLREVGMLDSLQLLHCHVGSQVSTLESLRGPLEELARVYVALVELGCPLGAIDVGGGLGVDYVGSRSGRGSSIDYGVAEYADLVIRTIGSVCDEAGVAHPRVFSESGRAMVASSSVLVVEALGRARFDDEPSSDELETAARESQDRTPLDELGRLCEAADEMPIDECLARADEARDRAMAAFRSGRMGLRPRAIAEQMYAAIGRALVRRSRSGEGGRDVEERLAPLASDLYFANFSVFQSIPDSWALEQVFPICPLHRLDERPTREAILADITCDSDGELDRFTLGRDERPTLPLHELRSGEPYCLGIFMVGAYQEILGDLHNLLGDTHAVHVRLDDDGAWTLEEVIPGDTVREVLGYVHYDVDQLLERVRREVEGAIKRGALSVLEGKSLLSNFALGLDGYTYLE